MANLSPVLIPDGIPTSQTVGAYEISVINPRHIYSIACNLQDVENLKGWVKSKFNILLPAPGKKVENEVVSILSSALDQWFIEHAGDITADLPAMLDFNLAEFAYVTEQTGGWVRFEIKGSSVACALSKLCSIDLESMSEFDVARTDIHKIGCLIWPIQSGFSVMGPRSSSVSLWRALADAALSVSP